MSRRRNPNRVVASAVRVAPDLVVALDELLDREGLARLPGFEGVASVTRAGLFRLALRRGLAVLEEERAALVAAGGGRR